MVLTRPVEGVLTECRQVSAEVSVMVWAIEISPLPPGFRETSLRLIRAAGLVVVFVVLGGRMASPAEQDHLDRCRAEAFRGCHGR